MAEAYRAGSNQDRGRQKLEPVKSRNPDGSQNREYYRKYYELNKERKKLTDSRHYEKVKSDPILHIEHKKRATEATRRWRSKNPEKVKISRRNQYLRRKRMAMDLIGGAICANCKCEVIEFLEFNHINGGGAKEFRESTKGITDLILSGKRPTDDLNVLCRVCNALDHLARINYDLAQGYTISYAKHINQEAEWQTATPVIQAALTA